MKIALIDIDHTVSHAAWRDSMLEGAAKWDGWDAYHRASMEDKPVEAIVQVVNALHQSRLFRVVGFTSRPEKWRRLTMEWMVSHGVLIDEVLMRSDDDFRSAIDIKRDMVRQYLREEDVALVIDDRDDVCAMFRGMGIAVLQAFAPVLSKEEKNELH